MENMSSSERPRKDATFLKLSNLNSLPVAELTYKNECRESPGVKDHSSSDRPNRQIRDHDPNKLQDLDIEIGNQKYAHNNSRDRNSANKVRNRDYANKLKDRNSANELQNRDTENAQQSDYGNDFNEKDYGDKFQDQDQDDQSESIQIEEREPSKLSGKETYSEDEKVQTPLTPISNQQPFRSKREATLFSADLRTRHTAFRPKLDSEKQETQTVAHTSNGSAQHSSKLFYESGPHCERCTSGQSEKSNLTYYSLESQSLEEVVQSPLIPSRLSCTSDQSNRATSSLTSSASFRLYPELGYPDTSDILRPNYPPIGYPPDGQPEIVYPQTKFPDNGVYPGGNETDSVIYTSHSSRYSGDDVTARLESRSISAYSSSSARTQASVRFKDTSPYPQ